MGSEVESNGTFPRNTRARVARRVAIALVAITSLVSPVMSQIVADQMTCAQALAYYQSNRVIYKSVHGKALPVRIGTPIAEAQKLTCHGRGVMERRYSVATTDQRKCVIAVYCE